MTDFIDETVRDAAQRQGDLIYPLPRAETLEKDLREIFSTYLGNLVHGRQFDAEGMLVTGRSGSGKTRELEDLIRRFNASGARLSDGRQAQIAQCMLSGIGGWKGLGARAAKALGYPIASKSKLTHEEIWDVVLREAELRGVVGIHFDEVQHIFRKRSDLDRLAILDAFKTLMKTRNWPLILIFSGVPELDDYIREEGQLYRLMKLVPFEDVILPDNYKVIHEIVGSYALNADIEVDEDLMTEDFLNRLATAGAYRWGLIIHMVRQSATVARKKGDRRLAREHFVDWWVSKTKAAPAATPFLHRDFETMFRKDHPFLPVFSG